MWLQKLYMNRSLLILRPSNANSPKTCSQPDKCAITQPNSSLQIANQQPNANCGLKRERTLQHRRRTTRGRIGLGGCCCWRCTCTRWHNSSRGRFCHRSAGHHWQTCNRSGRCSRNAIAPFPRLTASNLPIRCNSNPILTGHAVSESLVEGGRIVDIVRSTTHAVLNA